MEQYTRRNSLRISGISEEHSEDVEKLVMSLAKQIKAPGAGMKIDRGHRTGSSIPGKKLSNHREIYEL